jgi:hypothetical protein
MNTVFADEVDDLLNKCEIAPNPKPSVMVYDYELSPETLMPSDVGVLTITLKNMQDKPIKRKISITTSYPNVNTETYYTMDAYIKEAYVVERDFKVYNRYVSAGVIGPNEKVDLAFKIKAPLGEGIYMLKFIADIEDMKGKSSKGIRYFIPITISGTVNILPLEVSQNEVRLEVTNEGLSDVDSVYVVVSNATGVEVQPEKVYIGKIKSGDSTIVIFNVIEAEEEGTSANTFFKAVYRNGVNRHESNPVCVRMPCSTEEEKEKEKGESLSEERSENSLKALTATTTPIPTSSNSSLTPAVFAFAGLLVLGIPYLFLSKRKRRGKGEGKDVGGDKE